MKKAIRVICVVVALLMVSTAVLAACEKQTTVTISTTYVSVRVNKTFTLTAASSDNSQITWSTSDATKATVENGVVKGVAEGKATITATNATGAKATCEVTVIPANATYADDGKHYTYNSSAKNTPSNWNEMDYQSNDDSNVIVFIASSFFGYDYALKDPSQKRVVDGKLNMDNIDLEHHIVTYEAATNLEDVTALYADEWGLTAEQTKGYIWRITLRDDLAWDDGTPIKASDFVYSMKEQLNYDLQPYRADNYWTANGMKIHNAKNYYFQGRTVEVPVDGAKMSQLTKEADGKYTLNGASLSLALYTGIAALEGDSLGDYVDYYGEEAFDMEAWATLTAVMNDEGKVPVTDETLNAVLTTLGCIFDGIEADDALLFLQRAQTFASMTFDQVGIFAESGKDDLCIIVVLDEPESWLRDNGKLSYTISNASLPLVKQDLYESLKTQPIQGSDKWTTTYNMSVATSASWGPYKMTFFQEDKQYVLERNIYWYGYSDEDRQDQYLADKIVIDIIPTEEAAKLAFWKGQIDDLDFSYLGAGATEYQNSDYAMFVPSTRATAYGIQLYSNLNVLKNSGKNNGILAIRDFRWALSLAFDRNAFIEDQLVGLQVGLGLLGPNYYYDPENSLTYRESEQAKAGLLRTYGFTLNAQGKWTDGTTVYADIDDATDAMTGYNLTVAKEKLALAITELTANAEKYGYDSTKDIVLRLGKFNDKAGRRAELLQNCIDKLVEGSALQGKIKVEILEVNAQKSADDFREGKFEIYCVAGIGGAIFYPFTSMDSYLGFGSLTYHSYMDTNVELTMTMPAGDYECAGETLTLTTRNWFNSLNGRTAEGASHNWSEGSCPTAVRLEILAMLEEYALSQYHTIQVANDYSAYLNTAKSSSISKEYNTFMALGGTQYMRYHYTDEEWTAFLAEHNNDLSTFYKTSSVN